MTYDEFAEKYQALSSNNAKESLIKGIISNKFIPSFEKEEYCKKVVAKTVGRSYLRYIKFSILMIDLYTSLCSEATTQREYYEEFDRLDSLNLIDLIYKELPASEISKFQTIFQMVSDDIEYAEINNQN